MKTVLKSALRESRAVWMLILVLVIIGVQTPVLFTGSNILNILLETSVTGLLAAGETFVIMLAEIDLSDGAILGLSAGVTAMVLSHHGLVLGLLAGLAVGAGCGLFNGLLVTVTKMPSFIATLGTMSVFSGLTLELLNGNPIAVTDHAFNQIGQSKLVGIPLPAWIMVVVFLVFGYLLARTRFGRFVYAAGDNPEASRLSGIPVGHIKVWAFVISGVLSALAGFILTARLSDAEPTAGSGLELEAIAAVIIGGTSLLGGRGNLVGTLIGALILGVIADGMALLNVSPFLQGIVQGGVILFAVFLDRNVESLSQVAMSMVGRGPPAASTPAPSHTNGEEP
jgi:ribose/xylose/arabinose/galactoside ABC-type transport system permease subunit